MLFRTVDPLRCVLTSVDYAKSIFVDIIDSSADTVQNYLGGICFIKRNGGDNLEQ